YAVKMLPAGLPQLQAGSLCSPETRETRLFSNAPELLFILCHANLDDRPLDTQDCQVNFIAGRAWNQAAGRCAILAGIEALSAVQQGSTVRIIERTRDSLRTFPGAGRKAKAEGRLAQHGVAQRFISRLR